MSNLSDIGFPVQNQDEWMELLDRVQPHTVEVKVRGGSYFSYSDASGAQLWVQVNAQRELIGMNPHFTGTSRRTVRLTRLVERDSSPLEGGFYGWANPRTDAPEAIAEEDQSEGDYPFFFIVPDIRAVESVVLPSTVEVQLAAFASDDMQLFDSTEAYDAAQEGEVKFAAESFIPSGLFTTNEDGDVDTSLPPQPYGLFAGTIAACEERQNALTGAAFWWLAVNTLGGMVDVVAAPDIVGTSPRVGGIVSGSFYLSGRVLNAPITAPKPRFTWAWQRK